jgi:hypothetical protein
MRSECWVYDGHVDKWGYGRTYHDGRTVSVHRASYEAMVGPLPSGLELDHVCRNPACYNPSHLEPVTRSENVRRSYAARGATLTEHGQSMYANKGCRCDVCKAGMSAYQKEWRSRRG